MGHSFQTAVKSPSQSPGRTSIHAPMIKRHAAPASQYILQPKADRCACGGSCPRCQQQSPIQKKLAISEPGDAYEREADRVADEVLAAPAHPTVSGSPPRIQRFAGQPTGQGEAAPPSVDQALASPGRPLEPTIRQDMEQRFGHDFSSVRIHPGAAAERSARDVNAHAYTVGHDMLVGAGGFAPGMNEGRRLIAHELMHVVQHSGVIRLDQGGNNRGLSPIYSHAAEKHAAEKSPSRSPGYTSSHVPMIMRQPMPGSQDILQPKAAGCTCGGGCPLCEAKGSVQSKLRISRPGDALEHEADRIADAITKGSSISPARATSGDVPVAQRQAWTSGVVGDGGMSDEAARGLGAGRALDSASRDYFESRLGHDLGHVRLHTGVAAAQSATALGARAYTMGRNVVFGAGEYAPGSFSGQRLLAHELVHVVQQGAASPRNVPVNTAAAPPKALAPGAYSLRIVDEQGGEKFLGPPVPDMSDAASENAQAGAAPREIEENIPVQRTPKEGATPTVFIQRAATFTKCTPKPDDPLTRIMNGLTPGLTTPEINGTKKPSGNQLQAALSPSNVTEMGSGGGKVRCQFDKFNIATTAEQIVSTAAPAGGWSATIGPAAAISSEAKCAKVAKLPITMNALPDNADFVKRVQKSEDEHCNDLKWLHDRYLVPYDAFVNGLRGSGADLPACEQDLVNKLGFRSTEVVSEFSYGWNTSVQKLDGPAGTHTDTANIAPNANCSAATLTVNEPTPTKAGARPGNVAVVSPTVTDFNPTKLKVVGKDLKEGGKLVKQFSSAADATAALAVIQHYGMTSRNLIGPFEYFLVGKGAPSGALKGANEVAIDPKGHQVTFDFPNPGEWAITETSAIATGINVNLIATFGAKRDEAYSAWSILSSFGFTQKGWVGGTRQKPEMTYFRV